MHIQVVNFNLEGITHDDYMKIADNMAPVFAGVEGLKSKVWLSDQENNTYGGVYTWDSKQDYETMLKVIFSKVLVVTQTLSIYHPKILVFWMILVKCAVCNFFNLLKIVNPAGRGVFCLLV